MRGGLLSEHAAPRRLEVHPPSWSPAGGGSGGVGACIAPPHQPGAQERGRGAERAAGRAQEVEIGAGPPPNLLGAGPLGCLSAPGAGGRRGAAGRGLIHRDHCKTGTLQRRPCLLQPEHTWAGTMGRLQRLACVLFLWLPQLQSEETSSTLPEQVHLSYPGDPTSMTVTWTTFAQAESVVVFGPDPGAAFTRRATGNATQFVDGGRLHRTMFIHSVTLKGLLPGQRYAYRCGSPKGWSRAYSFQALLNGSDWSPRFALFGDMGKVNPQSLPRLQHDTEMGLYDVILHIGDFAYDLDTNNARVGDAFMRKIEPVAALVPYMTCPGNHEQKYNFSNYRARFSMPGGTESLWYSWDAGPAHIISFSTEVYFFLEYGEHLVAEQFQWLVKDLQEASQPERRKERPWIITMGHRPMYCSNNDHDDCTKHESIIRQGLDPHRYGLEDLFYKYGVDLELWAHEHSYERLWPVYDYKVYNGSMEAPYTNPGAPVHIITGSAGCRERLDPFVPEPREWSAARIEDYGYARMQLFNRTHLWLEQVSDDQNGKVVDGIWLIKERHGPEARH